MGKIKKIIRKVRNKLEEEKNLHYVTTLPSGQVDGGAIRPDKDERNRCGSPSLIPFWGPSLQAGQYPSGVL